MQTELDAAGVEVYFFDAAEAGRAGVAGAKSKRRVVHSSNLSCGMSCLLKDGAALIVIFWLRQSVASAGIRKSYAPSH
jgi:hypothetical protein